ncbi:cysteine sulfinic acid decarboxylase-like [Liolophura sinensis]|uniref:cysteine sulfinic acid decarboxylase-like n=1 Tax=Liolophura sinensis TaxID=3198878 RepID=UPI00315898E3
MDKNMNGSMNGHALSGALNGVQNMGNAKMPRLQGNGVDQTIVNGVERSKEKMLKMKKAMNGMENQTLLKCQNGLANGCAMRSGVPADGSGRDLTFLKHLTEVIMSDALDKALRPESKVVEFRHPKELESLVDLRLEDKPVGDVQLLDMCRKVIKYSVKSGHQNFYNQLFGGFNMYGLGGAWLTEALNTSQYTFEVAPLFTLMEKEVFKTMRSLIGFNEGDGIFCPGGSISNMYAISLARFKKFPEVKTKGMHGIPPVCILTSEQSHYSLKKGAAFLGIGLDNVMTVKCDDRGKMMPAELRKTIDNVISQGFTPVMVNATAGTTVLGAYDPIEEISGICQQYGIWLHVDGAWGGSVLLSRKHRNVMAGVHKADSMTWNPHKMMGAPLQCSAFLTKHKDLLDRCHSAKATYLFQQDKFYDVSYDTGDKSVQCGRKVDVLKLWLLWKAKGNTRFEEDINNVFDCARYLTDRIATRPGFKLVLAEPECANVCFWYIPPRLRNQPETTEWWAEIGKVAPEIKKRMMKEGTVLVGYQPLEHRVNFFRMVIANLQTTRENMDFFISEVERLGNDL